jgi:TolB protein
MKNKLRIITIIWFLLLIGSSAHARIYIPIDQPSDHKFPIAICNLAGGSGLSKDIPDIIRNDLTLSGYFNVLPVNAYQKHAEGEGTTKDSIRFGYWSSIEAQALVKGTIDSQGGKYIVTLRLFDPYIQEMLVGKQYTFTKKELREVSHRFSDEIMEALTGIRGVFNTKIAYTVATRKGGKDIYVMDMDGENNTRVTNLKSITLSPAWSPDGSTLAFTSYMRGSPDLYTIGADGKGLKQLVGGNGSKITPSWSPDGTLIAFSSSLLSSDAKLYTIPSKGSKVRQITNSSSGIDLAPTWSPDGGALIFASDRVGGLHLYRMSSSGGPATRLTFVGYQNDMPNWSPMGDKVAFAGRDAGTFDIFIMNPDGSNIQRLTIGSGSNEHPNWSSDGRFIVFSSTRGGELAICLMRADGSNQTRISKGNGLLPQWGPRVK